MSWVSALLSLLTALPKILDMIQSIWNSWQAMRQKAAADTDNSEIKDEVERAAQPGGRPDAP